MARVLVVGAGPNGLTAAARLARSGHQVLVREATDRIGGAADTRPLTRDGFRHDVGSAIHPLGAASPAFAALGLTDAGLNWVEPPVQLAHPLDGGRAAIVHRSLDETAAGLGDDGRPWARLMRPFLDRWETTRDLALSPPLRAFGHPLVGARLGLRGLGPATWTLRRFDTPEGRALWAGLGAHGAAPLSQWGTAGVGLVLGVAAHAVGWPLPRGGARSIVDALADMITATGGEIEVSSPVTTPSDLEGFDAVVLDVPAGTAARLLGDRQPASRRRAYRRFRRGPGVFKLDLALDGPVPWQADEARRAGTVHVGGTAEEVVAAEAAVGAGDHPERPFVLVAQQSLFDDNRAPDGKHTLWAYCHVPNGSTVDVTEQILGQIERFAPGFRDVVVEIHRMGPDALERENPSLLGGDITGGALTLRQLFARPTILRPYDTGVEGVFLGSASTPPGAGVHGMCGWRAAGRALDLLG